MRVLQSFRTLLYLGQLRVLGAGWMAPASWVLEYPYCHQMITQTHSRGEQRVSETNQIFEKLQVPVNSRNNSNSGAFGGGGDGLGYMDLGHYRSISPPPPPLPLKQTSGPSAQPALQEYSDNDRHGVVSVVFDALEEPLPGEVYLEAAQKVPKLVLPANASKDTERDSSRPTGKQYSSSVPREANFQGEYIRIMFEALDSLPWTRVDVNIPNVKSHEHIILKSGSHNKALHKIIFHVIANFVW